jgi:hypothetical protein
MKMNPPVIEFNIDISVPGMAPTETNIGTMATNRVIAMVVLS